MSGGMRLSRKTSWNIAPARRLSSTAATAAAPWSTKVASKAGGSMGETSGSSLPRKETVRQSGALPPFRSRFDGCQGRLGGARNPVVVICNSIHLGSSHSRECLRLIGSQLTVSAGEGRISGAPDPAGVGCSGHSQPGKPEACVEILQITNGCTWAIDDRSWRRGRLVGMRS